MNNIAYILKGEMGSVRVLFTQGWPWVRETASGKILTDGCCGDVNGYIKLEENDEVLMLIQGYQERQPEIELKHPILAEVTIGRKAN